MVDDTENIKMEKKRRLGYLAGKKHDKISSSYDNDTFVFDSNLEWTNGDFNGVITSNDVNISMDVGKDVRQITNGSEKSVIDFENYLKNYSVQKQCSLPPIDKNTSLSDIKINELKFTSVAEKQSSLLMNGKSSSFDCKRHSRNESVNYQDGRKVVTKQRSISETRIPFKYGLKNKTKEFENDVKEKYNKKHKFQVFESLNYDTSKSDDSQTREKPRSDKRWLRKLARYATFDEGNMYLAQASQSSHDLWQKKVNQKKAETENKESDETSAPQRKISASKLFRQSMSNGISKFKQLSIAGRSNSGGGKVGINYCMIDNDVILHETSKRLVPIKPSEMLPNVLNYDPNEQHEISVLAGTSFRRSFSVPEYLDSNSICDEELSDLYLPRRMAICPDLPVPAMSQLRTYLVLTRLKQYCIV